MADKSSIFEVGGLVANGQFTEVFALICRIILGLNCANIAFVRVLYWVILFILEGCVCGDMSEEYIKKKHRRLHLQMQA